MSHKVWVSYIFPYSAAADREDAKWRRDNFGVRATTGRHYGNKSTSITLHVTPEEAAFVILRHESAKVIDIPDQQ
jgi:hypothetical protein